MTTVSIQHLREGWRDLAERSAAHSISFHICHVCWAPAQTSATGNDLASLYLPGFAHV